MHEVGGDRLSRQNEPEAHHYTPQWLSKRFCDDEGLLWWRRRDWPAGKLLHHPPKRVFVENNLNTRYADDGSKDVRVEKALAVIDGRMAGITAHLVDQARRGQAPCLDEGSRSELSSYMFVQFKRPRETSQGSVATDDERVDAILEPSSEVSRVLDAKGLYLCSAARGAQFLVGSQVVLRAGVKNAAGCLEDPHHGLVFPLAFDVLLGFFHGGSMHGHEVLTIKEVDGVNRATARHCEAVAGPSRETVIRATA